MLGPTLAPEQQEALMHILVALQQSGDAVPQQDLDVVQVNDVTSSLMNTKEPTVIHRSDGHTPRAIFQ
jgi:hypothetical protein